MQKEVIQKIIYNGHFPLTDEVAIFKLKKCNQTKTNL